MVSGLCSLCAVLHVALMPCWKCLGREGWKTTLWYGKAKCILSRYTPVSKGYGEKHQLSFNDLWCSHVLKECKSDIRTWGSSNQKLQVLPRCQHWSQVVSSHCNLLVDVGLACTFLDLCGDWNAWFMPGHTCHLPCRVNVGSRTWSERVSGDLSGSL